MGFAIVVDSTCDWEFPEYAERNVTMVPLKIEVGGESFADQYEISSDEFYDRMAAAEQLPKTSQPAPFDFVGVYNRLAEEGYDHIISLHIAAPLSGTAQSATLAAAQVNIPVSVIDSRGATAKLGLLATYACQLRDAGASAEEAVAKLERATQDINFLVACDTLENFLKGGRLSADQVENAAMLNIKMVFTFNEDGAIVAADKAKGMNGVLKSYVKAIQKLTEEEGTQRIRFCHVRNVDAVEKLKAMLADAGIEYVDAGTALCGATVGTHLGIGAVGAACLKA